MKTGIYISGLGQSFQQETVVKYATRIMNEISYNNTGIEYEIKTEKIHYSGTRESNLVSIIENKDGNKSTIYKIYDFPYNELLTCKFNNKNIFAKSLSLLGLVIKKIPLLFMRLFTNGHYNRPFQTAYIFSMFLIIALSIIFTIPAVLQVTMHTISSLNIDKVIPVPISNNRIESIIEIFVSGIAALLVLMPQSRNVTTKLATEFNCINNYIEFGTQSQEILGNLDLLVEYIAENEQGSKIHFHTYSCGSIIAIDYLFQFGNEPSGNSQKLSEVLITIGSPFEFIKAYYPNFYLNRCKTLENNITWINVYSIADAMATNFRRDSKRGDAQFGLPGFDHKPYNLNYEVAPIKRNTLFSFLSLYSMQVHNMYWDIAVEGQSCMRIVYNELNRQGLFYEAPVNENALVEETV
jgi:hypothetical protein